jgi:plastocyanin
MYRTKGLVKTSSVLAVVFGIAFVTLVVLVYIGLLMPKPPTPAELTVAEYVPGVKRWPGDWKQESEPVIISPEPLGEPEVVITIDVITSEFRPSVIRVKQGQVVKLVLRGGDDGVLPKVTGVKEFSGHGFHVIGPYDIWVTGLRKGVVKEVIFKATYPGEFDIECTVFCSPDHYLMRGKLIVEKVG